VVYFDPSAAVWRKSTKSGDGSGNCVEVCLTGRSVVLRDSHDPAGSVLELSRDAWLVFVKAIRCGEFESPNAARLKVTFQDNEDQPCESLPVG